MLGENRAVRWAGAGKRLPVGNLWELGRISRHSKRGDIQLQIYANYCGKLPALRIRETDLSSLGAQARLGGKKKADTVK